jgi:release factor glutamine methyltransferase
MVKTPDLSHLKRADYENVYEPAEDTFILMDALEAHITSLPNTNKPFIVVELGCGSGCVSTFVGLALEELLPSIKPVILAVDINPFACEATKKTAVRNSVDLSVINDNLCMSIGERLKKSVDLLIFNPPYVATSEEEYLNATLIEKSWAGGPNGRQTLDSFITSGVATNILRPDGAFFLVMIRKNKPNEFLQMALEYGFSGTIALERKTYLEHLYVVKMQHK